MRIPPGKDIFFVGVQGALFLLYLVSIDHYNFPPIAIVSYCGLTLAAVGLVTMGIALLQLNKNLTPFPTPKEEGTLIQSGLYKYIRHPIYSGIILTTLGYGVYQGSFWRIGIGLTLWVLFFFKSRYEEGMLRKRYGGYCEYAKRTGRFFPFW